MADQPADRLADAEVREIADADPWATYTASIPRQLAAELRARVSELETERDEARAEAAQAVRDVEPIDAVRGQLDIARRALEWERYLADLAHRVRNAHGEALRAAWDRIAKLEIVHADAIDIARSNSHALDEAQGELSRTRATLRRVLASRRHWQDRTIALTDALDCGCHDGEIYMPIPMVDRHLPGDAPTEVTANA
ncbi:hypothetical protein ACW2Q0_00650 [Nocardia sp. R16R-3T]